MAMLCTVLLPNLIVSCYSKLVPFHSWWCPSVRDSCRWLWNTLRPCYHCFILVTWYWYHDSPTIKSSCLLPLCRLTLPWIHEYLNSYKYSSVSLLVVSSTAIGLHCMTHAVPAVQLWYIMCTVTSRVCACLDLKSCNFCLDCPISIILWFSGTLKWALSFGILKRGGGKCKIG